VEGEAEEEARKKIIKQENTQLATRRCYDLPLWVGPTAHFYYEFLEIATLLDVVLALANDGKKRTARRFIAFSPLSLSCKLATVG